MNGQLVHYNLKRTWMIPAILVIMMLGSCDFKPKEEYFRDLDPNVKPPVVTIDLNGGNDTIFTNYQLVELNVDASGHNTQWLEIVIDSVPKRYFPFTGNSLVFNPFEFVEKDGIYTMRLNIGVSTGTHSIADEIGAESFVHFRDICLISTVNKSGAPGVTLTPEAGQIRITCPAFPLANIDRSVILKGPFDTSNAFDTVAIISEVESQTAWDDSYVGERTVYQRNTFLGNRHHTSLYPYASIVTSKEPELPVLSVTKDDNGIPTIRWTKSRYAANIGKYRLYRADLGTCTIIDSTENPSDTLFHYSNCKFPDDLQVVLTCVPKKVPHYLNRDRELSYFGTTCYNNHTGTPSFYFTDLQTPAGGDFYYNFNKTIFRYDIQNHVLTDSIKTISPEFYTFELFHVSPNNKFLISTTGATGFSYMVYDVITRQVRYFSSAQVAGPNPYTTAIIADNGIGMVAADGKMTIHDFVANQRIMRIKVPQSGPPRRISPEGKYFITGLGSGPELYRVDTDTVTRIWGFSQPPYGVTFCEFVPGNPEQVVVFGMNSLTVRNCSDFSVVRTLNLNLAKICNIDFNTGRILGLYTNSSTQTYEWRIYDFQTGALINSIPRGGIVYLTDTRLSDQFLYWTDGYKFRIQ